MAWLYTLDLLLGQSSLLSVYERSEYDDIWTMPGRNFPRARTRNRKIAGSGEGTRPTSPANINRPRRLRTVLSSRCSSPAIATTSNMIHLPRPSPATTPVGVWNINCFNENTNWSGTRNISIDGTEVQFLSEGPVGLSDLIESRPFEPWIFDYFKFLSHYFKFENRQNEIRHIREYALW